MSSIDASHSLSIRKIGVGGGRIALTRLGDAVTFTELSSSYPLKLLSSKVAEDGVGLVYVLTYGGGLVGGDHVNLLVDIGDSASLVVLTQGSTKVFRTRIGDRQSLQHHRIGGTTTPTTQITDFNVAANGALFFLPEPVTCFRSAAYNQVQTYRLASMASAVILDWVTSGRKSLGEEWDFSRYYSVNDILVNGERVAKDVLLLDDNSACAPPVSPRTLRDKLAPYSCFATVFLFGPLVQATIKALSARYKSIVVLKHTSPEKLIWSLSETQAGSELGAIVKVAGLEPEDVRLWLREALIDVEALIGVDTYRRAFTSL